jgi:hypothetical protein
MLRSGGPGEWVCPYLSAEPDRVAHWRRELAEANGLRVAIHFLPGDTGQPLGWGPGEYPALRSIPLECFAPLARVPGVRLVSVQLGEGREQLGGVGFEVLDLAGRPDYDTSDLRDLAAVLKACNLFVTNDSGPAHVAGALGVPSWVLLPRKADARWLEGSPDPHRTSLYPNVAVLRLGADAGDWQGLLRLVAQWLAQWPGARGEMAGGSPGVAPPA